MQTYSSEAAGGLLALSNDIADAVERAGRAVVGVNARQRIPSSGIHWRQGVVVTAAHTLERHEEITVILPNGQRAPATLAGDDPSTDIAVLKLQDAGALPAADWADSASLKAGHLVLALARPSERGISASFGVISAVAGAWQTWHGGRIDQLVRPDLNLYPGFSGGPLIDARGFVIGMNTSGLSRRTDLTIPVSTIERIAGQLLARGRVARGYLGVGLHPVRLPSALRSALNLPGQTGLVVVMVEPGGPADQGGILLGDVLIAVDGSALGDTDDLHAWLGPDRVGQMISASLIRGGTLVQLSLRIGERPRRER